MFREYLKGKKIALIIAFRDFKDEEFLIPKKTLESAGAEIEIVSTKKGIAIGSNGKTVKVGTVLSDLQTQDFDAIVFIGGSGVPAHLDNSDSYRIAQNAKQEGKVVAAICISPLILAKAGILQKKKATVWSSPLNKQPARILQEKGAIYEKKDVVIDGKIVTANGPAAAKEFGEKLLELLK